MPAYHVTFPGLQITRCDFLVTPGIYPSVATLQCIAVDPGAGYGPLTLWDGDEQLLVFRDCVIDRATMAPPMERRGYRMRVNVLDRRWRWRYKTINGRFNLRRADGSIDPDTTISHYNLLRTILQALGETNYQITLPDHLPWPPHVEWYESRADLALAWICDRIGLLIVLDAAGQVRIVPSGSGPLYPPNGLELVPSIDTVHANWPQAVYGALGPTVYQMKVSLEAVGVDTDGSILPIDDLSYAPDDGWGASVPETWTDVLDPTEQELAARTVYRWYRVKEFLNGDLTLPVAGQSVESIACILPLLPWIGTLAEDGSPQRPSLEGKYFNYDLTGQNAQSGEWCTWDDTFELDHDLGIVKLPYPVYLIDDDNYHTPAELALTCAFHARPTIFSGRLSHGAEHALSIAPAHATGRVVIDDVDSFRCVVQEYNDDQPSGVTDNNEQATDQARALAECYALHYEAVPALSMQWNGIIPLTCDGNIHFVRWLLGGGQVVTWGGKNIHYLHMHPSRQEQRLQQEATRRFRL